MMAKGFFTAKLQGGAGNQLFQVAAAEGEALASGREARYFADTAGPFAVERFLSDPLPRATASDVIVTGGRLRTGPVVLRGASAICQHLPWASRESSTFDPRVGERRPTTMEGYFQHPSYFAETLGDVTGHVARALPSVAERRAVVAVHARGGDYRELGWELPLSYYVGAIELLPDLPIELVGADDALLFEVAGRLAEEGHRPVILPAGGEVDAFVALASAEWLVMSNSTFCWWAAVVGDSQGRAGGVVVPDPWLPGAGTALHRDGWLSLARPVPPGSDLHSY